MAVSQAIQQAILNRKTPDILGAYQKGQATAKQREAEAKQKRIDSLVGGLVGSQFGSGQLSQLGQESPDAAMQVADALGIPTDQPGRVKRFANNAQTTLAMLEADDPQGAIAYMQKEKATLNDIGIETPRIDEGIKSLRADPEGFKAQLSSMVTSFQNYGYLDKPKGESVPADQQAFENLIKGMSEEDKVKAREIRAGLSPRAVGSASQTITAEGTADDIADTEATIAERKKFAEMTGSSRAQAIDKGFDKVQTLSKNIGNLSNAIEAVRQGAGVGVIQKKFPSLREASVLLDQVQGELALDVIGSVTFGALSEGELALAKQIAIPTGLENEELITWLSDKQVAQQKLMSYFEDQIDHLDQGGTVASFLRKKRREKPSQPAAQRQAQPQQQPQVRQQAPQQTSAAPTVLTFDAQGNLIQ